MQMLVPLLFKISKSCLVRLVNPFSSFPDYSARVDEWHSVFNIGNYLLFQLSVPRTLITAVIEKVFTERLPLFCSPQAGVRKETDQ
jgi:hypothetical protein